MTSDDIQSVQIIATCKDGQHIMAVSDDKILIRCIAEWCQFMRLKEEKDMEFRRIFDTIPEQFDKSRPRYSPELFEYLIDFAQLGPEKKVLEIGPGTGPATDVPRSLQ